MGGAVVSSVDLGIDGIVDAVEIGRGGFGVVYAATETELDRRVAIKLLHGEFDEQSRIRFDRERRAMGSLSGHPNIVTVHRSGFTGHGTPYLLMEYLGGGSIADRLRARGPLPWQEVVGLGIDIGSALATAHRAGVLHRDVKPGNILCSSGGVAKLGDFGIARMHGAPETKSAMITASVAHAPPEVLSGRRPDHRSDIYSLASTLFEIAWGAPAFVSPDDESLVPMLARIAQQPPPDLRVTGMPGPVADVIVAAMHKDPDHRHPSADAFVDSLRSSSTGSTLAATGPATVTVASYAVAGPTPAPAPPPITGPIAAAPMPSAARPFLVGLGAAAVVAAVVIGLVALMTRDGDERATDPTIAPLAAVDGTGVVTTPTETTTTAPQESTTTTAAPAGSTTTAVTTSPTTTAPPAPPASATRATGNSSGSISVIVPADWDEQSEDARSLLVTPDLESTLADEWTKGLLVQVVPNTPIDNPGGFAPDATLDTLIASSECILRERGPYADLAFAGSYAVLDFCGDSSLSSYYVVAAPPDLSIVVFVAVQFESPAEDSVAQSILDSIFIDGTLL